MSEQQYLLTLDAGTGSSRALIFNSEGEKIVSSQREWSHKSIQQYPGSQVFDTRHNWTILKDCIKDVLNKFDDSSKHIKAVTATSMREGFVLYDKNGNELWAVPNTDARADTEVREFEKKGLGQKLYSLAGDWLALAAGPRLKWLQKNEPQIYEQVEHISMISDWVLYKLTGNFATEPSIGSSSVLFNISKRKWSEEIISLFGLPRDIYPSVYEAGSIIGKVTKKAAQETGLEISTPVVISGADTQLALAGVGATESSKYTIVGGSHWQTTCVIDEPLLHPEFKPRTLCYVNSDKWMIEGIGFANGLALRWFRDNFCDEEINKAQKNGVDPFYLLDKKAEKIPIGARGVITIFSDTMNARHWKHAPPSFIQFDLFSNKHSGKEDCYRALLENAAYVAYGNLQNILEVTKDKPKELAFCGGASKSFLWPQILSDVLNIKVNIPVIKESTCLGAMMYAGIGVGIFNNIKEAEEKIIRWECSFEPDQQNHEVYMNYYNRWKELYPNFLELVNKGLLKSMWEAPGT